MLHSDAGFTDTNPHAEILRISRPI